MILLVTAILIMSLLTVVFAGFIAGGTRSNYRENDSNDPNFRRDTGSDCKNHRAATKARDSNLSLIHI